MCPIRFFGRDHATAAERSQVVEVARLDGPTAAEADELVDRAVAAEKTGLMGRAYVVLDSDKIEGNRWLERTCAPGD